MNSFTFTRIHSGRLNELCFVVPTDALHIRTEEDAAVLHIAEHLLLEGAGKYSSRDLDVVADNFGGELVGEVWRGRVVYRFSYLDILQPQAIDIFETILMEPHLARQSIARAREDVVMEQAGRPGLEAAQVRFYAEQFKAPYGLPTDGTATAIMKASDDQVLDMAAAIKRAPGRLFYTGREPLSVPADSKLKDRKLPLEWRPAYPQLAKPPVPAAYRAENWNQVFLGFNLLKSAREIYAFDYYLRDQTGIPGGLSIHTLPGLLFWLASGPRELTPELMGEKLHLFSGLVQQEKRHYLEVGRAFLERDLSDATRANRHAVDRWIYEGSNTPH